MAADDDSQLLEGTVERIVYKSDEGHYVVARFAPDKGQATTIVGVIPKADAGGRFKVRGKFVHDSRYGEQFRVEQCEALAPSTGVGMQRYLGSGMIRGVGAELAQRIVDHFGTDTLHVIASEPERLREIDGIGKKRAGQISSAVKHHRADQDIMVFLQGHGVTSAYAARILETYGDQTATIVRNNPYRLAMDIRGIGFKIADSIAHNLGIGKESSARAEAGLLHILGEITDDGHVHIPEETLLGRAGQALDVEQAVLLPALDRVIAAGRIVREDLGGASCLSLRPLWRAEVRAAQALADIAAGDMDVLPDVDQKLVSVERRLGFTLAPEQRLAVLSAITDKLVVITGGPGVGKTTIVRGIVELAGAARWAVKLTAPTGRAAKRLSEATGREATTVHRLLEFTPFGGTFQRNDQNPLEADMVIVDEASMLDVSLASRLVDAVPPHARLVLVGDVDQLPSVGPGRVLGDIMNSGVARVMRLTEVFRQAAESAIVQNAHRINQGLVPELEPKEGGDFFFVSRDDPASALEAICQVVTERIPKAFDLDPVDDVQVLTPMYRGLVGATNLNQVLQKKLNDARFDKKELAQKSRVLRVGDKVMQIKNDYDREVYNGDLGRVLAIDRKQVLVSIDGRGVKYELKQLDQLVHAYAVTVHKSQGSEYPAVVLPLLTQHYMMLQRNLLYTAVTRGKRLVVVIGSRRALEMAVKNDDTRQRYSWLGQRLARAASHHNQ